MKCGIEILSGKIKKKNSVKIKRVFLLMIIKTLNISDDVFYNAIHVQRFRTHEYRHWILCKRHRSNLWILCVFLGSWRFDWRTHQLFCKLRTNFYLGVYCFFWRSIIKLTDIHLNDIINSENSNIKVCM